MAYTELAQPQEYELGTTDDPVEVYDNWDLYTGRLDSSEVQAGISPVTVDSTSYSYDNAGLITDEADTPSGGRPRCSASSTTTSAGSPPPGPRAPCHRPGAGPPARMPSVAGQRRSGAFLGA
jgi:hypothetical protein